MLELCFHTMLHNSLFSYRKSLLSIAIAISPSFIQADDFCPQNFKTFSQSDVVTKSRLVYVTSSKSYECKELTRDLLNIKQVNATLRHNFECIWLNSETIEAKAFIKKYRIKVFPAIVLISIPIPTWGGLHYNCEIGKESRFLLDQASFFRSAISISKQLADLMRMNHLSRKNAQILLAKAYVANDIRNSQAGERHYYAHKYTLGVKSLAVFQKEYLLEWERRDAMSKTGE